MQPHPVSAHRRIFTPLPFYVTMWRQRGVDMTKDKKIGYLLTIFGAVCWAFSGACGQYLFLTRSMTANMLVAIRLTAAGLLTVLYTLCRQKKDAVRIFRNRRHIRALLIFAIVGMALCQYAYFYGIELSNAATATTLEYTGPALILIWLAVHDRRMPKKLELLAVLLAMSGAYLLATHGDPSQLALSPKALLWCLAGAFACAVYTVQPREIIAEYGTLTITGFGMLIGGLLMCAVFRPWRLTADWDLVTVAGLAFIVLFGTICAFSCYLEGVHRIGPAKGSILAAVEPVMSTVLSVFWLGVPLTIMDFTGIFLIIIAMTLLAGDDSGKKSVKSA